MNSAALQKLGMTPKEIKVYIKLLELGSCGANTLAKRLDENRTSTYSLLSVMEAKGVISHTMQKGIKYFTPTDPTVLVNQYVEGAASLKRVLPELLAAHNRFGQKPKITFYEGVSGIKQICETLLEVPGSVRESFMGIDEKTIHPEIKRYFEEDIINRRIEIGQMYRGIITGYIPMGDKHPKTQKGQLRELKYVDPEKFPLKIHIDIFPRNKVAIYSYNKDEMMGVIIEHESFFIYMKTVFALAWAGAGKR